MEWTGNGLADGTAITSGNVNTAGNGDTVTRSVSGAPTMVTEGDGFAFYGGSADIGRLDFTLPSASRAVVFRGLYTHRVASTSGSQIPISFRSSSASVLSLNVTVGGLVQLSGSGGTVLATSPVALVANHKYRLDVIAALNSGTPTTSNGRVVVLITDLTSATWNTNGEWYYDSLYTVNLGTADQTSFRVGKTAADVTASPGNLMERPAVETITLNSAHDTRAEVEPYFISLDPDPITGLSVTVLTSTTAQVTWNHPADAPDGVTLLLVPGTHSTDAQGDGPGEPDYDPSNLSGASEVLTGLTTPPVVVTVPSVGPYSIAAARTAP